MPSLIRSLGKAALFSAMLIALPALTHAQSGSAGGSIGNDEKSLSGSRSTPRATETSKPARRSKPEPEAPRRASRSGGGGGGGGAGGGGAGGGNFDGAWVLTSSSSQCAGSRDSVIITSGRMVGQYGSGQVSPNGSVSGTGSVSGLSWTMSGRLSGRSGSGTFQRSDGCAGSWVGSKQ